MKHNINWFIMSCLLSPDLDIPDHTQYLERLNYSFPIIVDGSQLTISSNIVFGVNEF